jgi:hypothetical protein
MSISGDNYLGLAEKDYRAKIDATEPENGIFELDSKIYPINWHRSARFLSL